MLSSNYKLKCYLPGLSKVRIRGKIITLYSFTSQIKSVSIRDPFGRKKKRGVGGLREIGRAHV